MDQKVGDVGRRDRWGGRAKPGILMRAQPRAGTPQYLQGWAPEIDFDDTAKVPKTGSRTCVPVRCFSNVLETDEWNPSGPGAHQHEYYAPQVGNIRADFSGKQEKEKETLSLVKAARLDASALASIHQQALAMDKRGYTAARKVYQQTQPAS